MTTNSTTVTTEAIASSSIPNAIYLLTATLLGESRDTLCFNGVPTRKAIEHAIKDQMERNFMDAEFWATFQEAVKDLFTELGEDGNIFEKIADSCSPEESTNGIDEESGETVFVTFTADNGLLVDITKTTLFAATAE